MSRGERLLRVIDSIYDAALDPDRWPDSMLQLTELFGGMGASLEVYDKRRGRTVGFKQIRLPKEQTYVEHYPALNPRVPRAKLSAPGTIDYDYRFYSERERDRDDFYADFLAPLGARHYLSATLLNDADHLAVLAINRGRTQGHVAEADIELFERVVPSSGPGWAGTLSGSSLTDVPNQAALRLALDATTRTIVVEATPNNDSFFVEWIKTLGGPMSVSSVTTSPASPLPLFMSATISVGCTGTWSPGKNGVELHFDLDCGTTGSCSGGPTVHKSTSFDTEANPLEAANILDCNASGTFNGMAWIETSEFIAEKTSFQWQCGSN